MSHQRNIIIGTAGHIDHGKTVLVRALTGKDTDRLAEEKERGISIDLGFAPLELPDGSVAGIVDVPGHENFIRNMMAGATGIDLALLVVAADDGVMPQTREHLAILDLLGVSKAVVAITKSDLVDVELLELVREDIRDLLNGTPLQGSPVIAVSAVKSSGIDDLITELEKRSSEIKLKNTVMPARLPIDRVFTLKGIGTVVTGTLWSGTINNSDHLEILPGLLPVRVRSLQVHDSGRDTVYAGERVAANLAGLSTDDVIRGDVLASPGYLIPTYTVDANVRLLAASRMLKRGTRIRFHHGTRELLGRIYPLERNEIKPGENAPAQIRLESKAIVIPGDRFIIRSYSPVTTIGGGTVVDAHPQKHKLKDPAAVSDFHKLESFDAKTQLEVHLSRTAKPVLLESLAAKTGLDLETARLALVELISSGGALILGDHNTGYFISSERYQKQEKNVLLILSDFHKENPLVSGMPKETLKTKALADWDNRPADLLLSNMINEKKIEVDGKLVRTSGAKAQTTDAEAQLLQKIIGELESNPFQPPSLKELADITGNDVKLIRGLLGIAMEDGRVTMISNDLFFSRKSILEIQDKLRTSIGKEGISVSDFRQMINTTRKYAVPLLEYFDREKFTLRTGDRRTIR